MAEDALSRVEEGGHRGVAWPNDLMDGQTIGSPLAAFTKEVEEERIKRARWRAVLDRGRIVGHAKVGPGRHGAGSRDGTAGSTDTCPWARAGAHAFGAGRKSILLILSVLVLLMMILMLLRLQLLRSLLKGLPL